MTASLTTHDPVLLDFAEAVGAEGPVAIAGGRTRWDVGGPSTPGTRVITAPAGVVDHTAAEMTVTVRAGTPVAELHDVLRRAGQRSALPERGGTVGGAVAVGENDYRALGRGLLRSSVLQVRYVSAEGRMVTTGGPTVKNVTGFDLPRLIVGSLGTLGLVAEVILRTNPIPARSQWIVAQGVDPQAAWDTVLAPGAVLWDGTSTWVLVEGHSADVKAEHRSLRSLGDFHEVDGGPPLPPHRWSLTPAASAALDGDATGAFVSCVGLGLVFAERPQPTRPLDPAVQALSAAVKQKFDPSGRLNPGRDPGAR